MASAPPDDASHVGSPPLLDVHQQRGSEAYLKASDDVGAIAEGGPLYGANNKRCHGETGLCNETSRRN
jgi:hypothetical protein